jgi:hypothetical protein
VTFTRKEVAVLVVCIAMGVGTTLAIVIRTWEPAVACLVVLQLLTVWLGLTTLRRRPISHASVLDRIEQRLDELSLRVVTESQATARELSDLAEQLRRPDEAHKPADKT